MDAANRVSSRLPVSRDANGENPHHDLSQITKIAAKVIDQWFPSAKNGAHVQAYYDCAGQIARELYREELLAVTEYDLPGETFGLPDTLLD